MGGSIGNLDQEASAYILQFALFPHRFHQVAFACASFANLSVLLREMYIRMRIISVGGCSLRLFSNFCLSLRKVCILTPLHNVRRQVDGTECLLMKLLGQITCEPQTF